MRAAQKMISTPGEVSLRPAPQIGRKSSGISAPMVPTAVASMKQWVSKQIGNPVWQKSFYEHGIRNQQDYDEIWEYIENNPLKYALKRIP